ncbi:hypothetical protein TPA0907_10920 [Micromonospora humidisoli]|uniref:hypothetical protein n=1 Tax=Micromonospora sp. AKA109 TaxID=2733865 RepID=UPI0022CC349A|nr:hypothetical protein [Micromonospora sp. AKA109]GHJ06725.1 hypothetical protein TPA0907_10920 [Micromonospora sp. AKA109]
MSARRVLVVCALLVLVVAGCDRHGNDVAGRGDGRSTPVEPAWREATLPVPPGPAGRLVLRDAVSCAGVWFLVGGVVDATGGSRPAAWSSTDGSTWLPVPVAASTFYGRQHVLYAAACAAGRVAALGAKNGGVHGNPRTGTWVRDGDGPLREVPAAFELFGGPRAVSVARVAAGAQGWLIAGARADGAAVWTSPDAGGFTLAEGLPELAGDARGRTAAYDAVALPVGWLVVGSLLPAGGTALRPMAWTSVDGRSWRRAELPVPDGRGRAERVVPRDGGPVAVGAVSDGFAVWRADDGSRWRQVGGFGAAGAGVLSVVGLAVVGGALVAVTGDGVGRAVWVSTDGGVSWRSVRVPLPVADGGDTALTVAGGDGRLLLLADDGRGSHAWWGRV